MERRYTNIKFSDEDKRHFKRSKISFSDFKRQEVRYAFSGVFIASVFFLLSLPILSIIVYKLTEPIMVIFLNVSNLCVILILFACEFYNNKCIYVTIVRHLPIESEQIYKSDGVVGNVREFYPVLARFSDGYEGKIYLYRRDFERVKDEQEFCYIVGNGEYIFN